jgi:hypothetical protein
MVEILAIFVGFPFAQWRRFVENWKFMLFFSGKVPTNFSPSRPTVSFSSKKSKKILNLISFNARFVFYFIVMLGNKINNINSNLCFSLAETKSQKE